MAMEREPLKVPMMMFGKVRRERVKRDEHGKTIKDDRGKSIKEKVWVMHDEARGDQGLYPSVNHIYVNVGRGRKRLSKPAEDLFETWNTLARFWKEDNQWEVQAEEKTVIELTAYFPNDKIQRDTHNAFKLMLDAFEGVLYENDYYVLPRVHDFHRIAEGEHAYFEVRVYTKEEELDVMTKRREMEFQALLEHAHEVDEEDGEEGEDNVRG